MKKIVLLSFSFILLSSYAQDNWNAKKIFDIDIDDEVYNIYIDSVGTASGNVEFCFQTKAGKLIKTDFNGNVIKTTDNPYKFFTILNGDTLILKGHAVVNISGDTIADYYKNGVLYNYIAASSSGIYVFIAGRGTDVYVKNYLNYDKMFNTYYSLSGLCCCGGVLYGIQSTGDDKGQLYSINEDMSGYSQTVFPVKDPVGIAVYGGLLYVYSNADKAVYLLEPVDGTANVKSNDNQIQEISFFNLLGQKIYSSTGLTIVVTRYGDGTVRTEKKLF